MKDLFFWFILFELFALAGILAWELMTMSTLEEVPDDE